MKTRIKAILCRRSNKLSYAAERKAWWWHSWEQVDIFSSVEECQAFIDQYRIDAAVHGKHQLYPEDQ